MFWVSFLFVFVYLIQFYLNDVSFSISLHRQHPYIYICFTAVHSSLFWHCGQNYLRANCVDDFSWRTVRSTECDFSRFLSYAINVSLILWNSKTAAPAINRLRFFRRYCCHCFSSLWNSKRTRSQVETEKWLNSPTSISYKNDTTNIRPSCIPILVVFTFHFLYLLCVCVFNFLYCIHKLIIYSSHLLLSAALYCQFILPINSQK